MLAVFLKGLSFLFLGLFVLSVVVMFLTWRKSRAVKPKWIMFGQTAALVSLMAFSLLANDPLGGLWRNFWLVLGFAGGVAYGNMVRVTRSEAGIMMSYTLPYLITWSALLAITQFTTIVSGRVPVVMLGLSVISTGLNFGMNGMVVWKYRKLRKEQVKNG